MIATLLLLASSFLADAPVQIAPAPGIVLYGTSRYVNFE
jgi:hypothetical protein